MTLIIRVLCWMTGVGLITYGVFQFDPRMACIVAGVVLLMESREPARSSDADPGS
jgi:hypothetical protein